MFWYIGHDSSIVIYYPITDEFKVIELERIFDEKHYKFGEHYFDSVGLNEKRVYNLIKELTDVNHFAAIGHMRYLITILRKKINGEIIRMIGDYEEQIVLASMYDPNNLDDDIPARTRDYTGLRYSADKVVSPFEIVDHHHAHAFCAYAQSGMDKAWALTYDGGGDQTCFRVTKINSATDYESYNTNFDLNIIYMCIAYQYFSRIRATTSMFLDVAGKVMGMGAYANGKIDKKLYEILPKVTSTDDEQTIPNAMKKENPNLPFFSRRNKKTKIITINKILENLDADNSITNRRYRSKIVDIKAGQNYKHEKIDDENLVANTCQLYLENFVVDFVRKNLDEIKKYNNNVVLCGGTALNVLANQKLRKTFPELNFYVPSNPHDGGLAFGALWHYLAKHEVIDRNNYKITYSGAEIQDKKNLSKIIDDYSDWHKIVDLKFIATLLRQGKIIGFINGNSEIGPRALGNRSILADASFPDIKDKINVNVKRREVYRPFAPACIEEDAPKYFDSPTFDNMEAMQYVVDVKPEYQEKLSAITHADGTARLQVVKRENNEVFYDLIKEHGGVLLNTSFNLAGKPILNRYRDAIRFWRNSKLDCVVIRDDNGKYHLFAK